MRWTANDSLAYRAVTDAGERLRKTWDEKQAGDAYAAATAQTSKQVGGAPPAAMMDGIDDVGQLGYDGTGGQARTQYGLGQAPAKWQDTEYSPQQKRLAGLEALTSHYSARGDTENALKHGTMRDQAEASGMALSKAKRDETKEIEQMGADKEVMSLWEKSHTLKEGTPEHEAVLQQIQSKIVGAHGAVKGMEYMKNQHAFTEARRVADVAKREDAWWEASKSEDAAVARYDAELKDGFDAKVVVGKDGTRQVMKVKDGEIVGPLSAPYKSWDEGGRQQVMNNIPAIAKKEYELGITHKNRMAEIAAQGKETRAYAHALRSDKTLKMTDEQKDTFAKLDKQAQEAKTEAEVAAAAKAMHVFSNGVAISNGKEPKAWGGLGPTKAEKPAISFKDYVEAFPPRTGEPEEAVMRRYHQNVGGSGGVPRTAGGGMAALAAVAAPAGAPGKPLARAAVAREYSQRDIDNASKFGPLGVAAGAFQDMNTEEEARRREFIRRAQAGEE